MILINETPVRQGDQYVTKYEAEATSGVVEYTFPELQANLTIFNFGHRNIIAVANGERKFIEPNDSEVYKHTSAVTIQTLVGTAPFRLEGRKTVEQIVAGTVDSVARESATESLSKMGVLSELQTADKSSLVKAINDNVSRLSDITINVKSFGAKGDGVTDDTQAFINAINSVKSADTTETHPNQGVKGEILIPAGKYVVSSTVIIPSYVKVVGKGRNITMIVSKITNGDPVFEMTDTGGSEFQFYCAMESLTIYGGDNNCIGLKIYRTSRYQIRDIMVDRCRKHGLYLERAYLGEFYSLYFRACGSPTTSALIVTGLDAEDGSHAVSFFGGEIQGGNGTGDGVQLDHGISIAFFGTTIEAFTNGRGIVNNQAHALCVTGCYFEANKEHVVETGTTLASSYVNSYFDDSSQYGGRGSIGITYAQSCKIEGNYFVGSAHMKIFDASGTSEVGLESSVIRNNYAPSWNTNFIEQSIINAARDTGTIIETFDALGHVVTYGQYKFVDDIEFDSISLLEGIKNLGGLNVVIKAGNGSPEGNVSATKGLYFNEQGNVATSFYMKTAGTNNPANWKPVQSVHAGYSATRPVLGYEVGEIGYQFFDRTLSKPIWWTGDAWVDSNGTAV